MSDNIQKYHSVDFNRYIKSGTWDKNSKFLFISKSIFEKFEVIFWIPKKFQLKYWLAMEVKEYEKKIIQKDFLCSKPNIFNNLILKFYEENDIIFNDKIVDKEIINHMYIDSLIFKNEESVENKIVYELYVKINENEKIKVLKLLSETRNLLK